jgi:lysophospholipase L1-like esterase
LGWEDFDPAVEMATSPNLITGTVKTDRPDVVILLIGINDFVPGLVPAAPDLVDSIGVRLMQLRRQAESSAGHVLVSTVLPTELYAPDRVDRLNTRIRSDHPDFLPLGEAFGARDWRELLADGIHPNEEGYALLAELVENQLIERGLLRSF